MSSGLFTRSIEAICSETMLEPEQVSNPARITTFLSTKHKVMSAVRTKPFLIGRSAAAALAGGTGLTPTVLSMAAGVAMRAGVAGSAAGESSLWSRVW